LFTAASRYWRKGIHVLLTRMMHNINAALERFAPERRLFLKSDTDTRFIRLRPITQIVAVGIGGLALGWTILATSILLMNFVAAGSTREQVAREQSLYEERLNALSEDRDLRANEAAGAQARFTLALEQVAQMQDRLLKSEERRRELETGIDVIQNTLRRTITERDEARAALTAATAATGTREENRARDMQASLAYVAQSLSQTATERDAAAKEAGEAAENIAAVEMEKRALETRNDVIFGQLEQALKVTVEPLDQMFREAGLDPSSLVDAARRGYSGQGGPLTPIRLSSRDQTPFPEEARANTILKGLEEIDLYRIAAFQTPFALPVKSAFRYTSGFGNRRDPFGRGTRRHEGQDMAGAYGSPIYATADGVVTHAGWESGYGRLVKIRHPLGFETRYAHMSQIRVELGQKVSRGERIGDMGNSGRSTGTHLHYEVRLGGVPKNPMTFIKAGQNVF
jgi:murein DD-endopeptidase MepM/ murein hydrolase activator NlpD